MKKKFIFLFLLASFWSLAALSQQVNPLAYYTDKDGELQETTSITDGEAPLDVTFRANPTGMDDYTPAYEWHFRKVEKDAGVEELFVRYEEDTQYTFNESGTYNIMLKTYLREEGIELDSTVISITISESRLEFPNAFSPNDDKINDIYGAKGVNDPNSPSHYKNIVQFHAYIFNRWGQKIYEWTDVSKGWDGKHNGNPVKEGVYYVLVKAKGSDGREYNIRKDVNLLRGYTEGEKTGGNEQ